MQTETKQRRISKAAGESIAQGKAEFKHNNRSQGSSETAISSGFNLGPDILNTQFKNILSESEIKDRKDLFERHDIDAGFSVMFLYDSAKNYCELIGKKFELQLEFNAESDSYLNIILIYNELDAALPKDHHLNIDCNTETGSLFFVVYGEQPGFPDQFIFLPIKNVQRMAKPMADTFLEFIKYFSQSQGILGPGDHQDIDYIIDGYIPNELEMWEEEHDEENRTDYEMYTEGEIPAMFDAIDHIETNAETILNKCLEIRPTLTGIDLELIDIMIEGIPILNSGCLASFGYPCDKDSLNDDAYSGETVEFERTLAILWDDSDWFGELLQESINNDLAEFGADRPSEFLLLSPNTKEPLQPSDYPVKFYNWFCKLYEKIESYEPTN